MFKKSLVLLLLLSCSCFAVNKVYPTWDEVNQIVCNMCTEIDPDEVDIILGVSVGGLPPATLVSKYLRNKNIKVISASSYSGMKQGELRIWNRPAIWELEGKRVLVVDDIADTGATLIKIKELLETEYNVASVKIATVYLNDTHCCTTPEFYGKLTSSWIVFPWEVRLNPTN